MALTKAGPFGPSTFICTDAPRRPLDLPSKRDKVLVEKSIRHYWLSGSLSPISPMTSIRMSTGSSDSARPWAME